MTGRTFAIGDIHGCHVALDVLLENLQLTGDDTLIIVGDAVDRGPGTKQTLDTLLELEQNCTLRYIRGNHEEMMLDGLAGGSLERTWLQYGGQEALESYGGEYDMVPTEHIRFMDASLKYWESETDIFVHASLKPEVPLPQQTGEWLRWQRFTSLETPHPSGKRVVCGHTPQMSGLPTKTEGWICLDTWAYHGLYLSCIDVANHFLYQTQQNGSFRTMALDDLP